MLFHVQRLQRFLYSKMTMKESESVTSVLVRPLGKTKGFIRPFFPMPENVSVGHGESIAFVALCLHVFSFSFESFMQFQKLGHRW